MDGIALYYIHTRNLYYKKNKEIKLEVLNFSAQKDYIIDGIKVITIDTYKTRYKDYDLLVSHAPNLRNHYMFLKKYGKSFKKHIFFFHGHEVLKINKVYSKPYSYMKSSNKIKKIFQDIYDEFKLNIWHYYFLRNNNKSFYIFVSEWMKSEFLKWTRIEEQKIREHAFITYNSIGEMFEKQTYNSDIEKKYDFITIRGNLDGSKYCIDIVNKLAKQNRGYKFVVVGKGKYFRINPKSENIEWIDKHLNHNEIIDMLNKSKCALMPTRTDAQGLMACEIASFGIPLITSDIPVCHEIFDDFDNVSYIDNNNKEENIVKKYNIINKVQKKNEKYFAKNTCEKEIKIFKKVIGE